MSLKRTLPPANALVVFEAAARHLSFTAASAELGVAQPAVTRQIRKLEEDLRTPLFLRRNNAISLTEHGAELYASTAGALQTIAQTADRIRTGRDRTVTIGATFPFANLWLAPRLPAVRRALDGISVNLLISDNYADYEGDQVDCSIRFGDGSWPGKTAHLLIAEEVFPLATPDLAARHRLTETTEWRDVALLNMPMDARALDWATWELWESRTPDIDCSTCPRQSFDNYLFAIDSALRGEGLVLGFAGLTDRYEEEARLIRVGPAVRRRVKGYYLVHRSGSLREKQLRKIRRALAEPL